MQRASSPKRAKRAPGQAPQRGQRAEQEQERSGEEEAGSHEEQEDDQDAGLTGEQRAHMAGLWCYTSPEAPGFSAILKHM